MESIIAIGDIHGCYKRLRNLLERAEIRYDRDRLVFLGDYIDRGPDPFAVVAFLARLRQRCPQTVFLKGNHEEMLMGYLEGVGKMTYLVNGGRRTLESYMERTGKNDHPLIPKEHLEFFENLRVFFETDQYFFVHAGLRPNVPLSQQTAADMLWIRDKFVQTDHDFGKRVIFGHTPFETPLIKKNMIGIDTGAVYGHRLTALRLPEMIFYSA